MTDWTIPREFDTPANEDVMAFLRRESLSAHGDVDEELGFAAAGLPLEAFSPDPAAYAFVAYHLSDRTIVALAYGMNAIAFRVAAEERTAALRDGAVEAPEIGRLWIRFHAWRREWTKAERRQCLADWCARATAGATRGASEAPR